MARVKADTETLEAAIAARSFDGAIAGNTLFVGEINHYQMQLADRPVDGGRRHAVAARSTGDGRQQRQPVGDIVPNASGV